MKQKQSRRSSTCQVSIYLTLCLAAASASAYRPDHGFLGGNSVCDQHVPVTLEVPANAQAIPDPSLGGYSHGFYHVEEIVDDLFYATDGLYQTMFLVADEGILLVDAPFNIGVNQADPSASVSLVDVIFSIPETQGKKIVSMVYSHSRYDHIAAAPQVVAAFPDVEIVAHRETYARLRRGTGSYESFLGGNSSSERPPLPTRTFGRRAKVRVGDQRLVLSYRGAVHQPGNIYIYAPDHKVLMLVDVVVPGWSPFLDLGVAEDRAAYFNGADEVLKFDFDTFLGGHLGRLGNRDDVLDHELYMDDILANARSALLAPEHGAIFGVVPDNFLGAVIIFYDQIACHCANLTLDPAATPSGRNWLAHLGAADVYTVSHCFQALDTLRNNPTF